MIALVRSISAKKMLPSEAILECFCAGVGKRKGRRSEKMGKKRSKRFGVRGFFGERRGVGGRLCGRGGRRFCKRSRGVQTKTPDSLRSGENSAGKIARYCFERLSARHFSRWFIIQSTAARS